MNHFGAFSSSMNVTKTRMLQKMGREGRSYDEHYLNAKISMKSIRTMYEEEISRGKKFISSLEAFEDALLQFSHYTQELVEKLKYDTALSRDAWKFSADAHVGMADQSRSLRSAMNTRLFELQTFVEVDIHKADKARSQCRNSKIELDAAENSLQSIKENTHINEILRLQQCFLKAIDKYDQHHREAFNCMMDVLSVKDFRVTHLMSSFMLELADIRKKNIDQFDSFESQIAKLQAYEEHEIEVFEQIREKRMRERTHRHIEALQAQESNLIQMLMHPDLALIESIGVASTGNEKIVQMVVKILDAFGKLVSLMRVAINREVQTTQDHSTLFRGNSASTKLMSSFTRLLGKQYIDNTVKPFVEEILQHSPDIYEVDPAKAQGDVSENMERLIQKCQEVLDLILGSLSVCPPAFRVVAKHLQKEVIKRFPDSKYTCVGGFLFLRFFCPVLMSPDVFGLVEGKLESKSRRPLTLVCKTLQNLSNNIHFGKKESYMLPLNRFLDSNLDRTNAFFKEFVEVDDGLTWEPLATLEEVREHEVKELHSFCKDNVNKIGRYLGQNSPPELVMEIIRLFADLDSSYEFEKENPSLGNEHQQKKQPEDSVSLAKIPPSKSEPIDQSPSRSFSPRYSVGPAQLHEPLNPSSSFSFRTATASWEREGSFGSSPSFNVSAPKHASQHISQIPALHSTGQLGQKKFIPPVVAPRPVSTRGPIHPPGTHPLPPRTLPLPSPPSGGRPGNGPQLASRRSVAAYSTMGPSPSRSTDHHGIVSGSWTEPKLKPVSKKPQLASSRTLSSENLGKYAPPAPPRNAHSPRQPLPPPPSSTSSVPAFNKNQVPGNRVLPPLPPPKK